MVEFSRNHGIMGRRSGATDASFSDEGFGRLNKLVGFKCEEKCTKLEDLRWSAVNAIERRNSVEGPLSVVLQGGARGSRRTNHRARQGWPQDPRSVRRSHGCLDSHVGLLRIEWILSVDPKRALRSCRRRIVNAVTGVVRIPWRNASRRGDMTLVHQTKHVVFPPIIWPNLIADVRCVAATSRTSLVHCLPGGRKDERRRSCLPCHMRRLGQEMDHSHSHDDL